MFEFIVELLTNSLFLGLGEFIADSITHSLKKEGPNKFLALIGCFITGILFGILGTRVLSEKIFRYQTLPGISLVVVPLIVGLTANLFGRYQLYRGKEISTYSTFAGGALFAFSASLMRWLYFKMLAG